MSKEEAIRKANQALDIVHQIDEVLAEVAQSKTAQAVARLMSDMHLQSNPGTVSLWSGEDELRWPGQRPWDQLDMSRHSWLHAEPEKFQLFEAICDSEIENNLDVLVFPVDGIPSPGRTSYVSSMFDDPDYEEWEDPFFLLNRLDDIELELETYPNIEDLCFSLKKEQHEMKLVLHKVLAEIDWKSQPTGWEAKEELCVQETPSML